ncbi:hypothetical protein HGRIS_000526 [Hohenbuehelia grisea]|uniref:F-box domain-containing protein n=1 Tax=Hohenbuehelia grisea TaxID=104357 RepID=A0ABR3JR97_9AGAR
MKQTLHRHSTTVPDVAVTVQSLPAELLCEIFMEALDASAVALFNIMLFLWAFGHVCSRWRTIALSTPQLWQDIHIRGSQFRSTTKDRLTRMAFLEEWIARSGECPLFVNLELGRRIHREVVDLVTAQSPRWVEAEICSNLVHRGDMEGIRGNIPALRVLTIYMERMDFRELDIRRPTTMISRCFQIAPRLIRVHTNYAIFHFLPMPTDNLLELSFNVCFNLEIYELLRPCAAHLVKAWLDARLPFTWTNDTTPADAPRLLLPALELLSFCTDGKFIDMLTVPQLKTLNISAFMPNNVPDATPTPVPFGSSLNSFLSRSKCPLTHLTINVATISSSELVNAFSALPLLEHLLLNDLHGLDSSFFVSITHTPGKTAPLLPRLEFFRFSHRFLEIHANFSPDPVLDFLESRLHSVDSPNQNPRLRMVQLTLPRESVPVSSPQSLRFEALRASTSFKVIVFWSPQ